jgi:ribose/xylose/arabinose/galactoside ABC-type transport system permease subunit
VALVADQGPAVGLILLIAVTWTVFGVINGSFVSSFNLYGIGQLAARDAVLGMAQAALVVMGRMNLAVGSVGAICVSLLGYMLVSANISLPLTLLVVAAAGVIASVIMGIVELRSGLSSFIVTLAFTSAYGGGALLFSRSANFQITNSALNALGSGTLFSEAICPLVVVALICGGIIWVIYNRTSFGWKSLAIGANERAARASGGPAPVDVRLRSADRNHRRADDRVDRPPARALRQPRGRYRRALPGALRARFLYRATARVSRGVLVPRRSRVAGHGSALIVEAIAVLP